MTRGGVSVPAVEIDGVAFAPGSLVIADRDGVVKDSTFLNSTESEEAEGVMIPSALEAGRRLNDAGVAEEIGSFPLIIRPAYTLGGSGGGIAYNREEFEVIVARGLPKLMAKVRRLNCKILS